MAGGGRLLRSLDGLQAPAGAGRRGPGPKSDSPKSASPKSIASKSIASSKTLTFKTGPNMRVAGDNARRPRPDLDDVDEVLGASRWSSARFKLERVARRRRVGVALTLLFYAATGLAGMVYGGHWPTVRHELEILHVTTANALGFRVVAIATEGQVALTDDEVLLALGVKDDTALPFLDVKAARERLMANPLVEDATVRKLYPDRVTVHLVERKPFALWQHDGKVEILAADGTPIDEFRDQRFAHLPLVVGPSANLKAGPLLDALGFAPGIKEQTYAAVLVAERRWNLKLRSGVEVKLPETGYAVALKRLDALQSRENLFAKGIATVDLRVPGRTVVRLTPEAAETLAIADKAAEKAKKKAGGA